MVLSSICLQLLKTSGANVTITNKIAETELIGIDMNGQQSPLVLRIGRPYRKSSKNWTCAVEAAGLVQAMEDIQGYDSFQAIMLAARSLKGLLRAFMADGGKVLWPDDGTEVDLEELFPISGIP